MKIAFFTDTYEPQINGVVTSINIFKKYLEKYGNKVSVFSPATPGFKTKRNVFTFPSIEFSKYPGYRIAAPYKIRVREFDVVHVHTPFSMGLAGIAAAKFYKKPVVGTFHTLIPEFTDYFIKTRRFKKLLRKIAWRYSTWFYNMCDVVIAPSPEIKTLLKNHGIKKIEVVPTGMEKPQKIEKAVLRKKYKFSGKDKIVLHVGRISKEKNISFILKSLKNKPDNWILIITSDGPYKKDLKKMVLRLGMKNVIFTGFISKEKLNGLYFLADVLVVASKSETQGIVVAEAAARALPVVSLDAPVIANFIRKNKAGIVTREKNFLSSIKKTLEKNKLVVMKGYTIEETTKNLINIYKSLNPSSP